MARGDAMFPPSMVDRPGLTLLPLLLQMRKFRLGREQFSKVPVEVLPRRNVTLWSRAEQLRKFSLHLRH